jgi:hypothetical protein
MQQSPFWKADTTSAGHEITPSFVEPNGSLPCWQQPAIGLNPEPDESSPF